MSRRLSTRLLHSGEPLVEGAVVPPIFQSATFAEEEGRSYDDIRYARLSNTPTHTGLHKKLAAATGYDDALVTASGMAAISAALLSVLSAGDELLAQRGLYGGTHSLFTKLFPRLGIQVHFVDDHEEAWREALTDKTKAFYCEALTNPLLSIADLPGIAAFARENGLVSVIDNTFAGPAIFRPAELGFDLEVHSATKSLNGHSDLCAGVVAGDAAHVLEARRTLNLLGGSLDPHAAWLLERGMKTLPLRVRAASAGARKLAELLADHPEVARVYYPSLTEHPSHERCAEWFDDTGAMLAFELVGGAEAAMAVVSALEIPILAPSLGGVETLITLPAQSSHASMPAEWRRATGIADGLVRVAVGIEDPEDLAADFLQALERA
ncbi:MAG: PLP-dependent transferase [Deltaproteobacteria bacterium]|nr:MAG: PLP-dependent transferase [Deltaproteobacteria bacterium]